MKPNEYIELACRTESSPELSVAKDKSRLLHSALGLVTEAAEAADILKKYLFYNKEIDVVNLKEELGDLFWYIAIACDELGVSFEEIFQTNIEKLKVRYPDGYSDFNALDRNLEREREILEEA